jgi:hypothetical protein
MTFATSDPLLFPTLSDDQLRSLRTLGRLTPTTAGDVLFAEGHPLPGLIVVLEGSVAVLDRDGCGEERELAVQEPFPGCLPRETYAAARSSGSRRRPAKARWRCAWQECLAQALS